MNNAAVWIPAELMVFVEGLVARGAYPSATEAVHDALRLLRESEDKLESLRRENQIGIDELDHGETSQLDMEQIKALGRQSLLRH